MKRRSVSISLLTLALVTSGALTAAAHDPGECTHNHDNGNINGTAGHDTCVGTDAGENMYGRAGHDTFEAYGGNDNVYGDDGSDLLAGNRGNDYVYGGGASTNDDLQGGYGDDTVKDHLAWADYDTLCDGPGRDIIDMQDGDNWDIWQNTPDGESEIAVRKDPADAIWDNSPCTAW